ncbi:hypothetical protein [Streptomyces sp. NBC_01304]|uniref:hypothetical protein n=1 Tax=Streptomyces sp. NBC_01304 TaxID=2903818 RepID=UPI002E142E94|nr:hypothetical protein OG430_25480 [Streptomyces sp. NBC_01304]
MAAPHMRDRRAGGDLRLLRAAVFAAVCVVLSAGGHALASCMAVPLWTLGAGFVVVLAVAAPLAGRARSMPGIAGGLAIGQLALHVLFGLGQHGGAAAGGSAADLSLIERAARLLCGAGPVTVDQARRTLVDAGLESGGGAHAMHQHAGMAGMADMADMGTGQSGDMAGAHVAGQNMALLPGLPMLLGHLLAALAAGWLLRRGDLALLRLTELWAYGVTEGALVRSLRAALSLVRALRAGLPSVPEPALCTPGAAQGAPSKPRTTVLKDTVIRRGPPPSAYALIA